MHDSRVGRFFAVDPLFKKYPHNSPYAFSENRVIDAVELEGLEKFEITMNSFIPFKRVPLAPYVSVKGDNRKIDLSGNNASNRLHFKFDFDLDKLPADGTMKITPVAGSTSYFFSNPFTGTEYKIWTGTGEVGKEIEYKFTTEVKKLGDLMCFTINYNINAQIPFPSKEVKQLEGINPGPPINTSGFFLFIKNMKTGSVDFGQSHNLDGFPASEYFLNNIDANIQIPLLLFTPDQKSDFTNLLPYLGDRKFQTFNKTIVGSGGNTNDTWSGAKIKTEDETDKSTNKPLKVD